MATTELRRNYKMTDAQLCMFASNLCNFLTRDILDFSAIGLSAPAIASFKALGDAFEVFSPDGSIIGDVMITTENKKSLREQVEETIRTMALRVEQKWGTNSGKYRRLDIRTPSILADDSLLVMSRTVHAKMVEYQPDLVDLGLTPELLDDYEDLNEQFELAKNAQSDAVALRDVKKDERINKGNELYKMVTFYCNYGKIIYSKTNPAKYNDYVIYDSFVAGTLIAPENLTVDVITMIFTWDAVENATSYQLETSIVGTDWEEIYSGEENFVNYVPPVEGLRQYRVRARNSSGYGPSSVVMYYNYVAILPAPGYISLSVINAATGAIALNWEEVASAEFYRLYHSQTALNAPDPGEYTMLGEFTVASYSGTVNTGYRHWFQVVSGNSQKLSVASDGVSVDMPLVP
ncbi:MAG: fibronectin type III domain-containing protein [Candidatus Kapabacteria bacterium]|nr:fibronectin type III domain-containing protein [Candidatus Kapabacteria bacterium]